MVTNYVQSTPILTEDQAPPPRVVAGKAVLRERKPEEDDPTLGKRAGLTKQQLNAVKRGGGISLDSAVEAARRFGWSLDDLFGLTGKGRPPSEKEQAFDRIAAIVLRVKRAVGEQLGGDAGGELDDLSGNEEPPD